jgi:hypothetical protein
LSHEDLEQLLNRSVLTALAVHRDEGHVGALGAQVAHQLVVGVERDRLVPQAGEGPLDIRAGAETDAPLERQPTLEYRDAQAHRSVLKAR